MTQAKFDRTELDGLFQSMVDAMNIQYNTIPDLENVLRSSGWGSYRGRRTDVSCIEHFETISTLMRTDNNAMKGVLIDQSLWDIYEGKYKSVLKDRIPSCYNGPVKISEFQIKHDDRPHVNLWSSIGDGGLENRVMIIAMLPMDYYQEILLWSEKTEVKSRFISTEKTSNSYYTLSWDHEAMPENNFLFVSGSRHWRGREGLTIDLSILATQQYSFGEKKIGNGIWSTPMPEIFISLRVSKLNT